MTVINFLKIDLRRTRAQLKTLLLFVVLAVVITLPTKDYTFGLSYLCFAAVVLSVTPFGMQENANVGFLNMLPSTAAQRVFGRYLYGVVMAAFGIGSGALLAFICASQFQQSIQYLGLMILVLSGASLVTIGIQFTLMYALGNVKSKQFLGIIRIIPGFVLFAITLWSVEKLGSMEGTTLEKSVAWMSQHAYMAAALFLIVCVLIFAVFMAGSVYLAKTKDNR